MNAILDWYERAKAKLYAFVGNLLGLRQRIIGLRDRAARLVRAAERRDNEILIALARRLASEVETAYRNQLDVERKVQDAQQKIRSVDAEQEQAGVGVFPVAALLAAGAVAVSAVAAVVVHTQRVNLLHRALTDAEKRILTPGEIGDILDGGGGLGIGDALKGLTGLVVAGGAVYLLIRFAGPKRRRAA